MLLDPVPYLQPSVFPRHGLCKILSSGDCRLRGRPFCSLMAADKLQADVVVDSGSDVYFGTLHSPEKRRYEELELEDEGDVTLLDSDLRSQSPFKKQCTESITTRQQHAVFAVSPPVLSNAGHQVHESPMAGDATVELIDFNSEAVPASNAYQPPPVSTSLLDASFASSPGQCKSYQDSEPQSFEHGLLLNANHQSPQAQLLLDPAQTPTENFLDVFATQSSSQIPKEIVLAADGASCCVMNDGQAEKILQGPNGARFAEPEDGSFENAASTTPQSNILPTEELLPIQQAPVIPNLKPFVPKEQKRTLRSRSAIPARAIPANKQLRSGNKVSQTQDGLNVCFALYLDVYRLTIFENRAMLNQQLVSPLSSRLKHARPKCQRKHASDYLYRLRL